MTLFYFYLFPSIPHCQKKRIIVVNEGIRLDLLIEKPVTQSEGFHYESYEGLIMRCLYLASCFVTCKSLCYTYLTTHTKIFVCVESASFIMILLLCSLNINYILLYLV